MLMHATGPVCCRAFQQRHWPMSSVFSENSSSVSWGAAVAMLPFELCARACETASQIASEAAVTWIRWRWQCWESVSRHWAAWTGPRATAAIASFCTWCRRCLYRCGNCEYNGHHTWYISHYAASYLPAWLHTGAWYRLDVSLQTCFLIITRYILFYVLSSDYINRYYLLR